MWLSDEYFTTSGAYQSFIIALMYFGPVTSLQELFTVCSYILNKQINHGFA